MNAKYLFLNNITVSIKDAKKLVHDAQLTLLQALEESKLIYSINGFDDIVYKSVDEQVRDAESQLKYAEELLKIAKTNNFIDSTYDYINKNKNKLNKYSYDDIEQLINNSDFADKLDNNVRVIDSIYSIINNNRVYDTDTSLYYLGKNFSYVDFIINSVEQLGFYNNAETVGAAGFLYIACKLTDVA